MKRCLAALFLIALTAPALAQDQPGAGKKGANPDPGWKVTQEVNLPVGGTGYVVVTIDRKKLEGEVEVEIADLPQGISVQGEARRVLTRKEGEPDEALFILLAEAAVPAGKQYVGRAVLSAGGATGTEEFTIHVRDYNLQAGSAIIMGLSVAGVLILVIFCMWRVLMLPPVEVEEHLKGPLEIDTRDTQDAD